MPPLHTLTNYDEWSEYLRPVLLAMRSYAIVTGDDTEPHLLNINQDGNYDDWNAMEAEAISIIRLSCSPEIQCNVKGTRNPYEMWKGLES
jgi:hypothetical protein